MTKLTTHVLDVYSGKPGKGIKVELYNIIKYQLGWEDESGNKIENLKKLGFDVISIRPNPKVVRTLVKRDFYKYLNPIKITEFSLYSSAYIIAEKSFS